MDTDTEKIISGPLVSITMATYNRAGYIEEAIQSVFSQSYTHWELIIVDDGSSDDTQARVMNMTDPRIRYERHETNKGIHQTRVDAVAASRGTYIAVLDSDDVWADPGKLAAQVAFLETHLDHAIVGTFIQKINADGHKIGTDTYDVDNASIRSSILTRNQFAHSSVLMRRSSYAAIGGYGTLSLGEDLDLFLRLGTQGKFANIPEYMTQYRVHTGGVSRNALPLAMSVHAIIKKYRSVYPQYVAALLKSYLRIARALVKVLF